MSCDCLSKTRSRFIFDNIALHVLFIECSIFLRYSCNKHVIILILVQSRFSLIFENFPFFYLFWLLVKLNFVNFSKFSTVSLTNVLSPEFEFFQGQSTVIMILLLYPFSSKTMRVG